jgi:adenylate cyclase
MQVAILALMAGVVLAAGISILAVNYWGSRRSAMALGDRLVDEMAERVSRQLGHELDSGAQYCETFHALLSSGLVPARDGARVEDAMGRLLRVHPKLSLALWVGADGKLVGLRRHEEGAISPFTPTAPESWAKEAWYRLGEAESETVRSEPDASKDGSGLPVLSFSRSVRKDGKLQGVLRVEYALSSLAVMLNDFRLGSSGRAFLTDGEYRLVAAAVVARGDAPKLWKLAPGDWFRPVVDSAEPRLAPAMRRWLSRDGDVHGMVSFEAERERYFTAVVDLQGTGYAWKLGAIIPEADLLSTVQSSTAVVVVVCLILILVALQTGWFVARSFSRPLARLTDEMERVREFDLGASPPAGSSLDEVKRMHDAFARMKGGLRSFRKYVPADLVAQLVRIGNEAALGGVKRDVTLFFSDVADFTRISEGLEPEELIRRLGVHLSRQTRILMENGATVDKFIGDAVMAFWNAPLLRPGHAAEALRAAVTISQKEDEAARAMPAGEPVFLSRLGLHTGEVIVGNLGTEERMNYTVIGDAVNLASRLESLNKYYGTRILVSGETLAAAPGTVLARKLDRVTVKGKSTPVEIWEPVDFIAASEAHRLWMETWDGALSAYFQREWDAAAAAFGQVIAQRGGDGPSSLMLHRIEGYRRSPPPEDWKGITAFSEK